MSEGKCRTEEQDNIPSLPPALYGFLVSLYIIFFLVYSSAFTSTDQNPEVSSYAIELCKNAWCSHQTEVSKASYGRAADPKTFLLEEPRTGDLGGLKTR